MSPQTYEKLNTGYITSSNQADDRRYYEMTGEGSPIVFVHAGFVDSGMWDSQWHTFANSHRVVRYDQLGYGKSDPAREPLSRHVELARVIEELALEKVVLIGCSQGGTAALNYALTHPDNVAALVLVSATPSGFEMRGEPPADLLEMFGAMQQGDTERVSELQLRLWVDGGQRQPADVDAEVRAHAARMNKIPVERNTFGVADSQPVAPIDPVAAIRLGEIEVPTLVIVGSLDHPELNRAADEMVAQLPDARKAVIEGAAHVPNMEKPDEFNRLVLDFLSEKVL